MLERAPTAGYEHVAPHARTPGAERDIAVPGGEPGDFILTHGSAWTSRLIRWGQALRFRGESAKYTYWNHAALPVDTDGAIVEALGSGVAQRSILDYEPTQHTPRDAARSGVAAVMKDATEYRVAVAGTFASLDPASELPLWVQTGQTRVDHEYQLQERLAAAQFPLSFFAITDRETTVTADTNTTDAAARAHFALLSPGASFAGRPNQRTLFTSGANSRVLEQFNQLYGDDVQLSMSLMAAIPTEIRPGGRPVATAIGPGTLYEETDSSSILVFRANVVVSAFAPDASTALELLASLRPVK